MFEVAKESVGGIEQGTFDATGNGLVSNMALMNVRSDWFSW